MSVSCPGSEDEWLILLACNGLSNETLVILIADNKSFIQSEVSSCFSTKQAFKERKLLVDHSSSKLENIWDQSSSKYCILEGVLFDQFVIWITSTDNLIFLVCSTRNTVTNWRCLSHFSCHYIVHCSATCVALWFCFCPENVTNHSVCICCTLHLLICPFMSFCMCVCACAESSKYASLAGWKGYLSLSLCSLPVHAVLVLLSSTQ